MAWLRDKFTDWSASLIGTVALLPGLAAVATVVVAMYLGDPPAGTTRSGLERVVVVSAGFTVGLLAWAAFAGAVQRYARADRANIRMYHELRQRLVTAQAVRARSCAAAVDNGPLGPCDESGRHLALLTTALGGDASPPRGGPEWVLGSGYIAAWQQLHRAEEALLSLAPASEVAAQALYDAKRIEGSGIPHQGQLLGLLRAAITALVPGLAVHLPARSGESGLAEQPPAVPDPAAREIVRQTRRIINEYRDDAAAGLVTLRRRLMQSVVFTGLTAYLVLGLAVLAGVPVVAIASGAALYLIGALVGLLQRLHGESGLGSERQLDDYGLTTAKMVHLALLSGLAAIAGVVLVGLLSEAALTEVLQPGAGEDGIARLTDIFNLTTYPIGIILAAVFGLAPGLLLSQLGHQGEALSERLELTEANAGTQASTEQT